MERKILIVDDEADIREILQFNLENAGYTVDSAESAEEALEVLSPEHSLILLDVMMGGMSGFKMAEVLRKEHHNQIPIIFLTAKTSQNDLLTGDGNRLCVKCLGKRRQHLLGRCAAVFQHVQLDQLSCLQRVRKGFEHIFIESALADLHDGGQLVCK